MTWRAGKMTPQYWTAMRRSRCCGDCSDAASSASSSAALATPTCRKAGAIVDNACPNPSQVNFFTGFYWVG